MGTAALYESASGTVVNEKKVMHVCTYVYDCVQSRLHLQLTREWHQGL